jgi:sRNA-binding regulator protein Hfq
MEMAERGQARGEARQEEKPKEKPDLIRDLWREQTKVRLHLADGTVIEGRIKQFDQWNLQVKVDDGKRYWVPKHAVVYAEI